MSGIALVVTLLLSVLAALGLGTVCGLLVRRTVVGRRLAEAEIQASTLVEQAEQKKKALELEAKEEGLRLRSVGEAELRERRNEVQQNERRLANREEGVERRAGGLERREREMETQGQALERSRAELGQALERSRVEQRQALERSRVEQEQLKQKALKELESVAGLTQQEARNIVIKRAEDESQHELARHYFELDRQYKEEAEAKARKYIALSIQRLASEVVSEGTAATVPLPNDDMKGRLIGREGRNIRAIEQALGVDLIIDETPQAVTISCFDPVRREIARVALTNLIQDGRIHPTRVEEMALRAQKEVEQTIKEAGERAVFEAGVPGLAPDLIKLVGRLKYRTSYGGNVLQHSVESALLAGMMAAEVGCDVATAKMGALLHDIGKAMTHEVEGPHAEIGGEMAAKYGIPEPVRRAIMEHHDEEKGSVEAFIVVAADAISSARPGARRDTLEHYVKRLEALEEVARSFPGVEKCYAIQAGREVRIMVKPDQVDDLAASTLARDITKKIQETLVYPGQIKVVVIRETRAVEFAR